jgi:hypothetical protein
MSSDAASILETIKELQKNEQDLYDTLNDAANTNTLTEDQRESIFGTINELAATRVNLYNVLSQAYSDEVSTNEAMRGVLSEQLEMVEVMETNLNTVRQKLGRAEDTRNNELKMVEITTYQSKLYNARMRLMRIIAVVLIVLLALGAIKRYVRPLRGLAKGLITLVILGASILVIGRVADMSRRSSMNYDEYDFSWVPRANSSPGGEHQLGVYGNLGLPFVCAQSKCCGPGTSWGSEGCVPLQ